MRIRVCLTFPTEKLKKLGLPSGANDTVHLDRTANSAAAGHHLALPLHRTPPRTTPAQEFEEESSWYLEAGKGGVLMAAAPDPADRSHHSCRCSKSKSNRCGPSTPPPQSYKNLEDGKRKELLGTRLTSIPPLLDREGTKSNLQDEMRRLQELLCQPCAPRRCCLVPRNPIPKTISKQTHGRRKTKMRSC
jgi:hypothetical protein